MADVLRRLEHALADRYRIERQLGEGGMATVYLAEDLKHRRKVALKVLRPELAAVLGADRFLAEIETTANLQHPHILPLFDSGEADGFLFYVMPFVHGESLRERIERDRQLPVAEAVGVAAAVASALDHAHRHGVIHRDIKPANILLQDGQPVVADFGIALAASAAGGQRLTETGLSLGTPYYMSPEQATGDQAIGPAADIYALGCVLYEALVGEPPYMGNTAQAVLGKIIAGEPVSPSRRRATIPSNVDAAIRCALEKLPADRFATAQEFARALTDRGFSHGAVEAIGLRRRPPWRSVAIAASVAGVLGVAATVSLLPASDFPEAKVTRFMMRLGEGAELYLGGRTDTPAGRPSANSLAISPDGTLLVYAAWESLPDGTIVSRLFTRRFDQERVAPIPGSEDATNPFFSPDGSSIGFFVGQQLRRVSIDGGTPETVVPEAGKPTTAAWGATWGDDGTILYGGPNGLYRVPATGGSPELVAEVDTAVTREFFRFVQPHLLPGGRVALFHAMRSYDPEKADILALDLATRRQTTLLSNAMDPRYVAPGYLLFLRQGT